ncbi:Uncharacterized mitochondrial protein AtMg00310 [Linum perenne]
MDAVIAKFWWSGYVNKKSIHWCSKDRLTSEKGKGGLGFRSFKEFNLAHLAKLYWRIIQQPEALWVRVLKALYLPNCIIQERRQWDVGKLRAMFSESMVQEIVQIPIGPPTLKDKWIWHFDTNRKFSIRSCYKLLKHGSNDQSESGESQQGEWKWVWQLSLPPKIKFFVWRICSNLVATKVNLMRRRCSPDPKCPCCNSFDETLRHMLFECVVTKGIWREMLSNVTLPRPQQTVADWLLTLIKDGRVESCIEDGICCWEVWRTRNEKSFQDITPSQQGMCIRLNLELNLWTRARNREADEVRDDGPIDRLPTHQQSSDLMPRNPTWRFLCDGSFNKEVRKAGIGVITVNPEDRVVDGAACRFLCRALIVAEAYAVLTACKLAVRDGIQAEIWSDCRQVVQACLNEECEGPWECSSIIAEVKEFLHDFPYISIVNCRRDSVTIADMIAKKMRDHSLEPNWLQRIVGFNVL